MGSMPGTEAVLGALFCYLGYPLFEASLLVFGFLVGGGIGMLAAEMFWNSHVGLVVSVVAGGITGIFLVRLFVRGLLFLLGCLVGREVGEILFPGSLVSLLFGVGGGVLTLLASRGILIAATSLSGALLCSAGLAAWLPAAGLGEITPLAAKGLFAGLWVTGAAAQWALSREGS